MTATSHISYETFIWGVRLTPKLVGVILKWVLLIYVSNINAAARSLRHAGTTDNVAVSRNSIDGMATKYVIVQCVYESYAMLHCTSAITFLYASRVFYDDCVCMLPTGFDW